MKAEILSLLVTFVYEFEKHIELSIEVRGFDVLENSCFEKSIVETQVSQKMIPPQKKNVTNRVGIGSSFLNIITNIIYKYSQLSLRRTPSGPKLVSVL